MFIDEAKVMVVAGDGGSGMSSFRREKFVPRGGPDGGDGGRGGSVYVVADSSKGTLLDFRYQRHFKADSGRKGGTKDSHGKAGTDLDIPVPPGTIVRNLEGEVLADLDAAGKRVEVARGGRGGLGNIHFATSTNRSPRIAQKGEPGQELWITLELRLIADVGIIGQPNAGKSTFLAAATRATPKIADYPFTTLSPNLGVIYVGEQMITLADIPGLIEGSHTGIGLGHEFLRHIARTKILLHLVDGTLENPVQAFEAVNAELAHFDPLLARKPQVVAVNKIDRPEARERIEALRDAFGVLGVEPLFISANSGDGVPEVIDQISAQLTAMTAAEPKVMAEEPVILRPRPVDERFVVEREGTGFRVVGQKVERMVAMTDFENDEGAAHLQRLLKRLGVTDALQKAGVKEGDMVRFGKIELEWAS